MFPTSPAHILPPLVVVATSSELRKEFPHLIDAPAVGATITTRVIGKRDMVSVKRGKRHGESLLAGILGRDMWLSAIATGLGCVLALASVATEHIVAKLLAHGGVENAVAHAVLAVECLDCHFVSYMPFQVPGCLPGHRSCDIL